MEANVYETIRKALERQRSEAEDRLAQFRAQADRYARQNYDPGLGWHSERKYWTDLLENTNKAMSYIYYEFYNENGKRGTP